MEVRYFAWFDTKHEKTEFINLIRSCSSKTQAINKVLDKYPNLTMLEATGIVENFEKEINK